MQPIQSCCRHYLLFKIHILRKSMYKYTWKKCLETMLIGHRKICTYLEIYGSPSAFSFFSGFANWCENLTETNVRKTEIKEKLQSDLCSYLINLIISCSRNLMLVHSFCRTYQGISILIWQSHLPLLISWNCMERMAGK